jgi:hypothetical protein
MVFFFLIFITGRINVAVTELPVHWIVAETVFHVLPHGNVGEVNTLAAATGLATLRRRQ